jgi:predicted nucleic acid-binding protein
VVACVIDNSVVVAWLYAAQANEYSERILEKTNVSELHTSFIWPAEFANTASVMVKRGILSQELGSAMVTMANDLRLIVDNTPPNSGELYQLDRRFNLSAYDASYLELSIRLNAPLATRDVALMKASQSLGLYLN